MGERISKIMRTTGSIDNNNMDREMKSLSIERRQRELLRITQENKRILSQIMARKTTSDYSRENWEPKWKKEEYYMAQLSRFQPVSRKTKKGKQESDESNAEDNTQNSNRSQQQQDKNQKKSTQKDSKSG